MAYAGRMPFGSLFGGMLVERIGAGVTLEIGGVVVCLSALGFARALPEIRREARI